MIDELTNSTTATCIILAAELLLYQNDTYATTVLHITISGYHLLFSDIYHSNTNKQRLNKHKHYNIQSDRHPN